MDNLPNDHVIKLLNQIRLEDESASKELYSFYRNQMFRYVRSRVGDHSAVEDIVQETMAAATRSDRYDGSSLYSTWLCSIANNKMADWRRDQKKHPLAPLEDQDLENPLFGITPDIAKDVEKAQVDAAFLICIAKLSNAHRVVIRLVLDSKSSLIDAASTLEINEGTIKSRGHYARKELAKCMRRAFPTISKGDLNE